MGALVGSILYEIVAVEGAKHPGAEIAEIGFAKIGVGLRHIGFLYISRLDPLSYTLSGNGLFCMLSALRAQATTHPFR